MSYKLLSKFLIGVAIGSFLVLTSCATTEYSYSEKKAEAQKWNSEFWNSASWGKSHDFCDTSDCVDVLFLTSSWDAGYFKPNKYTIDGINSFVGPVARIGTDFLKHNIKMSKGWHEVCRTVEVIGAYIHTKHMCREFFVDDSLKKIMFYGSVEGGKHQSGFGSTTYFLQNYNSEFRHISVVSEEIRKAQKLEADKQEIKNTQQVEIKPVQESLSLSKAKDICLELGFKQGTEKLGECVLEMSK